MPKEIIVAIIALLGVVLSAFVSLLVSRRVVATESRKLRFEAKKIYDDKLLSVRVAIYPHLYFLLSSFIKMSRCKPINRDMLEELLNGMNEWDCKNAIFLSAHAGQACHDLRHYLSRLLTKSDKALARILSSPNFSNVLAERMRRVELGLKSDLGIYGVEIKSEALNVMIKERYD